MKALWVCEPVPDAVGEPVHKCIMKSEKVGELKQRGCEIAKERGQRDVSWVRWPDDPAQYQMGLEDDSLLTIREFTQAECDVPNAKDST